MKAPVDQGADAALQFLKNCRDAVDCMPPLERAQWFCGFITSAAAWSAASVGWHHTETMLMAALEVVPNAKGADNG